MNSPSFILDRIRFSIGLLLLTSLLFCQFPQPVQSISLSNLCGRFGHSCFGANWGKRTLPNELPQEYLLWNSNSNDGEATESAIMDRDPTNDYILEQIRLANEELFRHRLRQLLRLE
ncbi:unnamed protein product [Rotaria socialis]|uniref:Uncharacterized protein n=1 Tax=Rotaria socialis TaxID=392032 RepID=A0A820RF37_9BILA|nr:unnamed protein product [Rotaria socialis]CAF3373598.1 unnamed protein product [Rotaria socialis]CAF3422207.1 unnamed protein product [Rotaria socialis]CAF3427446.1 unnamed protein product [Rotaria socialis]CAF3711780.1 unnamed protein product [Rotaria socialis]